VSAAFTSRRDVQPFSCGDTTQKGLQMILLTILLTNCFMAGLGLFLGYWLGHRDGKREGWIAGRSLMRVNLNEVK